MARDLWINLPVKDIEKSKVFFVKLGFTLNQRQAGSDESAGIIVGDKQMMVMLFPESTFKTFTGAEIPDSKFGSEVLLSFGAESREEVDELAKRAVEAGGTLVSKPQERDWMYGASFADLDGHRWNVLYMDMSRMPKQ
ncbi:hypothetical protein DFP94_1011034 [Fontibacillus phaseoli]|uniref:VOC domain-containing protein n=1 Tax=Fontibacillus phaseoli TaxID=1416533 RepID=A0A369BQV6_9BACL|nr:VOC family protein [Fontibacillus phaseoli]RCX23435.1 hypothetical protein DFP94_1011034 [Fontibacillus phaseoli]